MLNDCGEELSHLRSTLIEVLTMFFDLALPPTKGLFLLLIRLVDFSDLIIDVDLVLGNRKRCLVRSCDQGAGKVEHTIHLWVLRLLD